jgi:uncharacterized integral membrane protein
MTRKMIVSNAVPIGITAIGLIIAWELADPMWLVVLSAACFGGSLAFLWDDVRLFRMMRDVERRLSAIEREVGRGAR